MTGIDFSMTGDDWEFHPQVMASSAPRTDAQGAQRQLYDRNDAARLPNIKGQTIIEYIRSHKKAMAVAYVADLLDCSPKTLYAMVKSRRLGCIRLGQSVKLDPESTADWLLSHSTI